MLSIHNLTKNTHLNYNFDSSVPETYLKYMSNWTYNEYKRVGDRWQIDDDDCEWIHYYVPINSCTARELAEEVPGIGPVLSNRFVDERKKNGLFLKWEDIQRRVYGIGPKLIQKMKAHRCLIDDPRPWKTLRMPTM